MVRLLIFSRDLSFLYYCLSRFHVVGFGVSFSLLLGMSSFGLVLLSGVAIFAVISFIVGLLLVFFAVLFPCYIVPVIACSYVLYILAHLPIHVSLFRLCFVFGNVPIGHVVSILNCCRCGNNVLSFP